MNVTFPHLGSMHIFCNTIAETAGIPYVVPPETSRKNLTLGVPHSNGCICLPLETDTIVIVGSGPTLSFGTLCPLFLRRS